MKYKIEVNPIVYLKGSTGWTDYDRSTVDYETIVNGSQKLLDEVRTILKTARAGARINITVLSK